LRALLRFARDRDSRSFAEVPLAARVWLGLGERLYVQRSRDALADRRAWRIDEELFGAFSGPFSALRLLSRGKPRDGHALQVVAGAHARCASPPIPAPERVAHLRRISVQPDHPADCLSWWTVDLFLNRRGQIRAVTLDMYEP